MRIFGLILGLFFIVRIDAAYRFQLVTSGFSSPIAVTAPSGDASRLFVAEQFTGRIRIYDRNTQTILGGEFLDVTGLLASAGEQGLLGLAFHPDYANNGYFYVNYTAPGGGGGGHTEIARFRVSGSPATSNVADPSSKIVILSFNQPENNHNGGWLGFGLDGYLYIASGDGGGGNDQHGSIGNGQDRNTLLGKILRINVDVLSGGRQYSIPTGNPYPDVQNDSFREEIWAWGLRNPWRCSIDRVTGDLWIGDVGQGAREEIDRNPAGVGDLNFGWRIMEGNLETGLSPNPDPLALTAPVYDYDRNSGTTVTGGYVYRGSKVPELYGKYVFADFGFGTFWTGTFNGTTLPAQNETAILNPGSVVSSPSSFGEDGLGELFVLDYFEGELLELVTTGQPHPVAVNDFLARSRNSPAKIHITTLLANDSDALGHTLNFQSFTTPSQNGGTITRDGDWLLYDPPNSFNSPDSFRYTINDGQGFTATATVFVTVPGNSEAGTLNIVSTTDSGNDVIIRCVGIPGRTYQIQTTSSLSTPVTWTPHPSGTLMAGADGIFQLTDISPPDERFYRAIQVNP